MDATKWDACTMDPHQWMRFIECHPGFAGYLQAIGVILTVAGAIFGPPIKAAIDQWAYARARRRATRNLAYGILPEVEKIIEAFDQRLKRLRDPAVAPTPNLTTFLTDMGLTVPVYLETRNFNSDEIEVERLAFFDQLIEEMRAWNMTTVRYRTGPVDADGWRKLIAELTLVAEKVDDLARSAKVKIFELGKPPPKPKLNRI